MTTRRLVLGIDERPARFWEALVYGWQHTLVDISPFVLPLAVATALGFGAGDTVRLINAGLLAMGVATLIQTTLGNRLPIIQGPSATVTGALVAVAATSGGPAMWGAAMVGALAEMLLGATRLVGALRRFFPPAVAGVVIVTIAFSLGQFAARLTIGDGAGRNFLFAGAALGAILALQILGRRLWGGRLARGAVFVSIWAIGLGLGSVLGAVDWGWVASKPWFGLPSLFPWGGPGFGWELVPAALLGVAIGYLGSIVESLGDYAATCEVAGETYTVAHMNRGIFAEGLGCLVALTLGGLPVTSYTQNIGVIATTGVASRFVVRVAAGILILYGLCPKFGALLVAMPRPVLGGVFLLVCGMIAVAGLRLLSAVPDTVENSIVIGASLVPAVVVPVTVRSQLGAWLPGQSPVVQLVLTNPVVLALLLAISLNLLLNGLRRPTAGAAA